VVTQIQHAFSHKRFPEDLTQVGIAVPPAEICCNAHRALTQAWAAPLLLQTREGETPRRVVEMGQGRDSRSGWRVGESAPPRRAQAHQYSQGRNLAPQSALLPVEALVLEQQRNLDGRNRSWVGRVFTLVAPIPKASLPPLSLPQDSQWGPSRRAASRHLVLSSGEISLLILPRNLVKDRLKLLGPALLRGRELYKEQFPQQAQMLQEGNQTAKAAIATRTFPGSPPTFARPPQREPLTYADPPSGPSRGRLRRTFLQI
jgi:hypothetical protein